MIRYRKKKKDYGKKNSAALGGAAAMSLWTVLGQLLLQGMDY
ncbi:MAG: hypothetical protein ACTHMM_08400 [Agriterribacter sp.]